MSMQYEGGCMCGAVRYVAVGAPVNERICHCHSCQKAIGAAFNARLMFRAEAVSLSGPFKTANSSPNVQRGFCPECGTTVFSGRESAGVLAVTSGSLDDPEQFRPTMHIWISSRQPWLKLDDGLPRFSEAAPA
ncbi:GFA family protein [Aminobacter sp. HY435]|uniref:GFA family protein n=1 Tax=Aminobacter sp. HY435 TaxID=2970917 RepID=UPI0022B9A536|nr:GFA family protein [Aminobacter sp. HY435]